jgi:hypothetical protein
MSSIRLSERHGVNPTIPCFFCGEQKNSGFCGMSRYKEPQ